MVNKKQQRPKSTATSRKSSINPQSLNLLLLKCSLTTSVFRSPITLLSAFSFSRITKPSTPVINYRNRPKIGESKLSELPYRGSVTVVERMADDLEEILEQCGRDDDSESLTADSHDLLNDSVAFLRVVSDCSDIGLLGDQDFEAYMERFEQELSSMEVENAKVSDEI